MMTMDPTPANQDVGNRGNATTLRGAISARLRGSTSSRHELAQPTRISKITNTTDGEVDTQPNEKFM